MKDGTVNNQVAYSNSEAGNYLARVLDDRALVSPAKSITLPNWSEPEP